MFWPFTKTKLELFALGPPPGSPLRKGMIVRVVETGGCDGGIRRRVWEGKITQFINAADKWPNSNFKRNDSFSIFAEIQVAKDEKEAFLKSLKGKHDRSVMHYPASRNYWSRYEDGVYEYYI